MKLPTYFIYSQGLFYRHHKTRRLLSFCGVNGWNTPTSSYHFDSPNDKPITLSQAKLMFPKAFTYKSLKQRKEKINETCAQQSA